MAIGYAYFSVKQFQDTAYPYCRKGYGFDEIFAFPFYFNNNWNEGDVMNYFKDKRIASAIITMESNNQILEKALDAILQGLFCFELNDEGKEATLY